MVHGQTQRKQAEQPHDAPGANDGIPAGDSPPKSTWPLIVAFVAWGGWLVFLTVMAVLRFRQR